MNNECSGPPGAIDVMPCIAACHGQCWFVDPCHALLHVMAVLSHFVMPHCCGIVSPWMSAPHTLQILFPFGEYNNAHQSHCAACCRTLKFIMKLCQASHALQHGMASAEQDREPQAILWKQYMPGGYATAGCRPRLHTILQNWHACRSPSPIAAAAVPCCCTPLATAGPQSKAGSWGAGSTDLTAAAAGISHWLHLLVKQRGQAGQPILHFCRTCCQLPTFDAVMSSKLRQQPSCVSRTYALK